MASEATIRISDHAVGGAVVRELCLAAERGPNVFSGQMIASLARALDEAERQETVAALIFSHTGKAFCAGTDLSELVALQDDQSALRAFLASLIQLLRSIERCRVPTIAAIEGAAVGGGFELALACDLRIMSASAWAALPETGLGTIPGGGGVQSLSRFIGRARTLSIVLTGMRLSAQECADLGLAQLATQGAAREQAIELGYKLAKGASRALSAAKAIILASETATTAELDRMALDAMIATLTSPEGSEGLQSVAQRRKPDFLTARGQRGC
jgi:methylglutaconyl-CoA hydratase